jgi:hypothetical protein
MLRDDLLDEAQLAFDGMSSDGGGTVPNYRRFKLAVM